MIPIDLSSMDGRKALVVLSMLRDCVFQASPEMAENAVWSEWKSHTSAVQLVGGFERALRDNMLAAVVWSQAMMAAALRGQETWTGADVADAFDDEFLPQLWVPESAMPWIPEESRNAEPDEAAEAFRKWWELPVPATPIGAILQRIQTPRATRTFEGRDIPAGGRGLLATMLFIPAETPEAAALHRRQGYVLPFLRPMAAAWDGGPAPRFYAPLLAMKAFMDQPFIASEDAQIPRAERRRYERDQARIKGAEGLPPIKELLLRRKEKPEPQEEGEGHRSVDWQGQWLVDGHWAWRASGPNHSQRKRTYVRPYVKGPADKPLVVKEKVVRVSR